MATRGGASYANEGAGLTQGTMGDRVLEMVAVSGVSLPSGPPPLCTVPPPGTLGAPGPGVHPPSYRRRRAQQCPQPPEPRAVPTPRPARSCPAEPPCRRARSAGSSGAVGTGSVYCDRSRGAARGDAGLSWAGGALTSLSRPAQPQGSSRPPLAPTQPGLGGAGLERGMVGKGVPGGRETVGARESGTGCAGRAEVHARGGSC